MKVGLLAGLGWGATMFGDFRAAEAHSYYDRPGLQGFQEPANGPPSCPFSVSTGS